MIRLCVASVMLAGPIGATAATIATGDLAPLIQSGLDYHSFANIEINSG